MADRARAAGDVPARRDRRARRDGGVLLMPRQVAHGTPSLSPRYMRPRQSRIVRWSALGAVALVAVIAVAYVSGLKTIASPGTVAAGHASIDKRCAQCHQPAKAASDLRCERCHDPIDTRRFENSAHAIV